MDQLARALECNCPEIYEREMNGNIHKLCGGELIDRKRITKDSKRKK